MRFFIVVVTTCFCFLSTPELHAQLRTEANNGSVRFYNGSTFNGEVRQTSSSMSITNRLTGSINFYTDRGTKRALQLNSIGTAIIPYYLRLGGNNDGTAWRLGVNGNTIIRNGSLRVIGNEILLQNQNNQSKYIKLFTNGAVLDMVSNGADLHIAAEGGKNVVLQSWGRTGGVGIGTSYVPSGYKVAIDGGLIAERVRVALSNQWADYVFDEDYPLMPLDELKENIQENGHLPNIPDADTVESEGIDVAIMQTKMMEKIEELTLYTIQLHERIKELEGEKALLERK